jgi:hypothetical protein
MPNELFRRKAITLIEEAIRESEDASIVDHAVIQGDMREKALDNVLSYFLPKGFEVGTGKIIDHLDFQSSQIDLIIHNKGVLPSRLIGEQEGLYPAESCFYAIEVKTTATAKDIRQAIAMAEELRKINYVRNYRGPMANLVYPSYLPIIPSFFAFSSDLSEGGKTELERYRECDPNFFGPCALSAMCVLGRGYWYFEDIPPQSKDEESKRNWLFHPPTSDHDEVIDFLAGIINTIPDALVSRGQPRLGHYLMKERAVRRELFNITSK